MSVELRGNHVVSTRFGQVGISRLVARAGAGVAIKVAILRVLVAHHIHHAGLLFHLARVLILHHHGLAEEVGAIGLARREFDVVVLGGAVVTKHNLTSGCRDFGTIAISTII